MTPTQDPAGPGPAQQEADARADAARAVIAASARVTAAVLPHVRQLLPAGWRASSHQAISGATHTVAIDPPTALVDATAYLLPNTGSGEDAVSGWGVRVHNRQQRVDFPLYTDGGAHAAVFTDVADAVTAAITALRIEAVPTRIGPHR
ncbi:hypothetical protein [Dactylosporangium sp. CA-092794]|uniref:hypothetical protein n=1 Tax=Dactylosporangium sp. CA-092794 TaxID=3239929 RepID=UPI003D91BF9F